jgi:maltose/moltooligosaccharide transporter
MKLDIKKTMLVGFGFLAVSIAWSIYNSYVPLLLQKYTGDTTVIGFCMSLSFIFGAVFDPIFGNISDKTKTKHGRRIPFLVMGVPVSAAAFFFIPVPAALWGLLLVITVFNFFMSTWRSPVIALMPDLTPSSLRSQANGVINFMGGIGAFLALAVGGLLYNISGQNISVPFILGGVVMLLALFMLLRFIREPSNIVEEALESKEAAPVPERKPARKRSLFAVLIAILFLYIGFSAMETFFTLYATHSILNNTGHFLTGGDATMLMAILPVCVLAAAIPAGFISSRIGRKKTVMTALFALSALFAAKYFLDNMPLLYALLILGGVCWAFVIVNALPMVLEMSGASSLGKYTGYYYIFSLSASFVSPILFGALREATQSYHLLFIYSACAFAAAFISMLFIARGDGEATKAKPVDAA